MRKLLVISPARRLGATRNGATGVKEHAWFRDFDWDSFAKRSMKAPYVPVVRTHHPQLALFKATRLYDLQQRHAFLRSKLSCLHDLHSDGGRVMCCRWHRRRTREIST